MVPYGTKIADAVAPVSFTASLTFANTGFPRCVSPAFLGLVPPTTFVPVKCQVIFPTVHRSKKGGTVVYGLLRVESEIFSFALEDMDCYSLRSLLPCKALVDDLGIAVYAEVFCCCSVGGCCCRIPLSSSSTSQGSSRAVPENLHCCKEQEVLQYSSHEEHTSIDETAQVHEALLRKLQQGSFSRAA